MVRVEIDKHSSNVMTYMVKNDLPLRGNLWHDAVWQLLAPILIVFLSRPAVDLWYRGGKRK